MKFSECFVIPLCIWTWLYQ